MANTVPEKLINFRVYLDGVDMVGIADAQLPSLEAMTETVKGAGIAGEVDSPVLGHFGSMALTLNWRTITGNAIELAKQKAHNLELRGAQQEYDAGNGTYKTVPVKVTCRAVPKKFDLGKLDVGASTESQSEFEVSYIKLFVDGEEKVELDKFNYIYKVNGEDILAEVRQALGLN
jgi:P2 family phage contractile tail tube protein